MAHAQPNVLVVMYDQLTPSALGCYGNPVVRSPHIDALAAAGVVFDAAYANSPLCTPARSCMMTGQLPSATGGYDNAAYLAEHDPDLRPLPARRPAIARCSTGKMHFVGPDQLHGFEERLTTDIYPADFGWTPDWRHPDERIDWWIHNMDERHQAGVAEVTNQLLFDDEVGLQAVRALHDLARAATTAARSCSVASFTHPHDPYVSPAAATGTSTRTSTSPCRAVGAADVRGRSARERLRHVCDDGRGRTITDDDVRRARRAYYGNISYVDEWTGRLMDTLRRAAAWPTTRWSCCVADHGDMLGERGLWYKMSFFEGSARVPLIVHAPARFAPARVAEPVSLVDVLPTLLELAGVGEDGRVDALAGTLAAAALRRRGAGRGRARCRRVPRRGRRRADRHDPPRRPEVRALPRPTRTSSTTSRPTPTSGSTWPATRRTPTRGREFRAEVARRWDLDALHAGRARRPGTAAARRPRRCARAATRRGTSRRRATPPASTCATTSISTTSSDAPAGRAERELSVYVGRGGGSTGPPPLRVRAAGSRSSTRRASRGRRGCCPRCP